MHGQITFQPVNDAPAINAVAGMAEHIWPAYYVPIIGDVQVAG